MSTQSKSEKGLAKWGLLGAVVASACCWLPLLLILLGVISISTVLTIGYYSGYFLAAGLALTGLGLYFYWRQNGQTCCATKAELKKHVLVSSLTVLAVLVVAYLVKYQLVPLVAPWVYEQSFGFSP